MLNCWKRMCCWCRYSLQQYRLHCCMYHSLCKHWNHCKEFHLEDLHKRNQHLDCIRLHSDMDSRWYSKLLIQCRFHSNMWCFEGICWCSCIEIRLEDSQTDILHLDSRLNSDIDSMVEDRILDFLQCNFHSNMWYFEGIRWCWCIGFHQVRQHSCIDHRKRCRKHSGTDSMVEDRIHFERCIDLCLNCTSTRSDIDSPAQGMSHSRYLCTGHYFDRYH